MNREDFPEQIPDDEVVHILCGDSAAILRLYNTETIELNYGTERFVRLARAVDGFYLERANQFTGKFRLFGPLLPEKS